MKKKVSSLEIILASVDYLIISLGFLISYFLRFGSFENLISTGFLSFWLFVMLAWAGCTFSMKLYTKFFNQDRTTQWTLWFRTLLLHLFIVIAFNGLIKTYFSRYVILGTYGAMFVLHPLWRFFFNWAVKRYYNRGEKARKAILVGSHFGEDFIRFIERNTPTGVVVLGFFGEQFDSRYSFLGDTKNVLSYLEQNNAEVDEIYCSLSTMTVENVNQIVEYADNNLIRVMFIPDQKGIPYSKLSLDYFGHVPVLTLRHLDLDEPINRTFKRLFDLLFSFLVIVFVMSWLTPLLAILIKLDSKGPVFFVQKRSGKNNSLFNCLKFRTMSVNEHSDKVQAEKGDVRITKIGAFLRKSSLDELPQFFNVFAGDMSVVGPRPHMVSHTEEYGKAINKFMVRHLVKPGITGLSQVMGLRGDTSQPHQMRNRVRIDIFYIENWSFAFDMKIVAVTCWNMLKGDENAY